MASKNSQELTKDIIVKVARKGIRNAARKSLLTMGYTIQAQNGWLVKISSDGVVSKIKEVKKSKYKIFELD
jgi:hypothetical protein